MNEILLDFIRAEMNCLADMKFLEKTAPEIHAEVLDGNFVGINSARCSSKIHGVFCM